MDISLLTTKVSIPVPTSSLIPRHRLVSLLEREIPRHRLTVVASPAGFGKTTLLADWASRTQLRVGWLTIESDRLDTAWFLRYLMAAWETFDSGIRDCPVGLLLEPIAVDIDRVLRAWVNHATDLGQPVAVVIDDAHLLRDQTTQDALSFLIEHFPATVHVIVSSREEPAFPLSRLRGHGELFELRVEDLALESAESAMLARSLSGRDVSFEETKTLNERLGGWVAAWQLVAIAARTTANLPVFETGEQNRFISEFVREEVLANLDPNLQIWLLQVSVLDSLCASLCEAVTGITGGQAMLAEVERKQLFLAAIDRRGEWFRLHPLFRDVLAQQRMRSPEIDSPELHRRAGQWYLEHELPDAAFEHAIKASDSALLAQITESYAVMKLFRGEFDTVRRWIQQIPEAWFERQPDLGLMRMAFYVFNGDLSNAKRTVDQVESLLKGAGTGESDVRLARVAAARCALACFGNDLASAERFAVIALNGLRAENEVEQANIHHALADTYRRNGLFDQARRHYFDALALVNNPTARGRSAHIYCALADLELELGHLRNAERFWVKARQTIEDRTLWGLLPAPIIGWVYVRMAELEYEWNNLEAAVKLLEFGRERANYGGDRRALAAAGVIGSAIAHAQGDGDQERHFLDEAEAHLEGASFPEWTSRLRRRTLERSIALGDTAAIQSWVDSAVQSETDVGWPFDDVTRLSQIRAQVCQPDPRSLSDAEAMANALVEVAERSGRIGVLVEALALLAIARNEKGNVGEAFVALERSLRQSEPEGYLRLYLDLGVPMARLLHDARRRNVLQNKVEALLSAFGEESLHAGEAGVHPDLIDPLSDRELEVLRLMAGGMTNREIADSLFISIETVKKHAGSVFSKLDVSNRTEAASRARSLNLLN